MLYTIYDLNLYILTYILGYNHNSILSMCPRTYVRTDEFPPLHIHQHYNALVRQNRLNNQKLCYIQDCSLCIDHYYIGTFQLDMSRFLFYSPLHRNDPRNHLLHHIDIAFLCT